MANVVVSGTDEFQIEMFVDGMADSYLGGYAKYDDINRLLIDNEYGKLVGKLVIVYGSDVIHDLDTGGFDVVYVSNSIRCDTCKNIVLNEFKPYDEKSVIRWINDYGSSIGVDLTSVAKPLFINCGNSTRKIHSEIQKLVQLSGFYSSIQMDLFKSVVCYSNAITPSLVIDSMCSGNVHACVGFYDKLQERYDETGWIATYLHAFLQRCVKIHQFTSFRIDDETASKSLNISKGQYYLLKKRYKLWTREQLLDSIGVVNEVNRLHREGTVGSESLLEKQLIKLSLEAKKCLTRA